MDIRERTVGAITALAPVGRLVLDEGSTDNLLKHRISGLMREGHRQFLLDLGHISQIDTLGLTSLVAAQVMVLKHGGQIKFCSPAKRVRDLLGITRLNTFFEVFDTEPEAIKGFAKE